MKKILSLIFCILVIFSLTCVVFAESEETKINEEVNEKEELATYIKEEIIPIVVGVITSVVALLGMIGSIKRALYSLKDTKSTLEMAHGTFKDELEKIKITFGDELENIKDELEGVPELKERFENLSEDIVSITGELEKIMQILALAYSSDEKLVRCGKAAKMYRLIGEVKNNEETP